jgi:hypothetical protein
MSAAATAAGFLYASGRLRGRQSKEHEEGQPRQHETHKEYRQEPRRPRKEIRVATLPADQDHREDPRENTMEKAAAPRRQPKVQYRVRRWRPDEPGKTGE